MQQIYRKTPLPSLQENILLVERRKFLQAYNNMPFKNGFWQVKAEYRFYDKK